MARVGTGMLDTMARDTSWPRATRRGVMVAIGGMLALSLATVECHAQQITGLYIGAGAGYSILADQSATVDAVVNYVASRTVNTTASYNGGIGGVASIGYGVGSGVRIEIEGSYRANQQSRQNAGGNPVGNEIKYGLMGNVFYDFDVGLPWLSPYIGAGFGYQFVRWDNLSLQVSNINFQTTPSSVTSNQTLGSFAYQAVLGVAFPIEYVPGLALTAEYRFMGLAGTRDYKGTATFQYSPPAQTRVHTSEDYSHTFLVGLRYAFNAEPEAPPPAAPRPATPAFAPAPAMRTYIVFFDWDRADLSPRAKDIVAEAVRASARIQHTRIEVSGNTDSTGSAQYNLVLSQRRAEAVAAEMSRWGVPRQIMDIHGYGDSRPLVPTGPGIREPQNRRVEIVYR